MHAEPLGVYITALSRLARLLLEMIPRLHELALGLFHLLTVHRFEKKNKKQKQEYLKVWLRRKTQISSTDSNKSMQVCITVQ